MTFWQSLMSRLFGWQYVYLKEPDRYSGYIGRVRRAKTGELYIRVGSNELIFFERAERYEVTVL